MHSSLNRSILTSEVKQKKKNSRMINFSEIRSQTTTPTVFHTESHENDYLTGKSPIGRDSPATRPRTSSQSKTDRLNMTYTRNIKIYYDHNHMQMKAYTHDVAEKNHDNNTKLSPNMNHKFNKAYKKINDPLEHFNTKYSTKVNL